MSHVLPGVRNHGPSQLVRFPSLQPHLDTGEGLQRDAGGSGKIGFHMLHAGCHSRIRYKKVCPVHGEVANDEIV